MTHYSVFREANEPVPNIREEKERASRRTYRDPDPAEDVQSTGGGSASSPSGKSEEVRSITLSVEGVANLLAGLAAKIEVSEPWDFASPDVNDVLDGIIEAS